MGTLAVFAVWFSSLTLQADCRTALGIPCHTIDYRGEQTVLFHSGFTDLYTISTESRLAVSADGSTYTESIVRDGLWLGGRVSPNRDIWIYNASSDRILTVFPQELTYSVRTPTMWHDRPYRRSKVGDATCSSGILHIGTDFRLMGFKSILGIRAAHWHRDMGNGGYEDAWLAPDLDCTGLQHRQMIKNRLYIPTFITTSEATRLEIKQPDIDLFELPANYREVKMQTRFRLRASK